MLTTLSLLLKKPYVLLKQDMLCVKQEILGMTSVLILPQLKVISRSNMFNRSACALCWNG